MNSTMILAAPAQPATEASGRPADGEADPDDQRGGDQLRSRLAVMWLASTTSH